MQKLGWVALVACLLAGGCSRTERPETGADLAAPEGDITPEVALAGTDDLVIGEPIRFKNLTVFPVASKTPRTEDRFITLDEGLKSGKVHVYEKGAPIPGVTPAAKPARSPRPARPRLPDADPFGFSDEAPARQPPAEKPTMPMDNGSPQAAAKTSPAQETVKPNEEPEEPENPANDQADVNRLVVVNCADRPLYLMPGEIIYGGQQDRTIGQEMIVSADGKPVEIEVFCVEHGRWAVRDEAQTATALAALSTLSAGQSPVSDKQVKQLAEEAKQGKFVAPAGSLGKGGRVAVQGGKDQSQVWNSVAAVNADNAVRTDSDAFTANYTDPEIQKQLAAYAEKLESPVGGHPQVVGAIVAINGKVESVDVFQSTPLFKKLWPKLLKSHALDAVAAAKQPEADKLATLDDAKAFFRTAQEAGTEEKSQGAAGLVVSKRDSEKVISFSVGEGNGMGGMGGMGAAFGAKAAPVHSNAFAK